MMEEIDPETADVVVTLEQEEVVEHLYLHSEVLCRAEYFRTQLCERWSSGSGKKPIEIPLRECEDPTSYIRFFRLLYLAPGARFRFSGVEEALGVLKVAARLLCEDCFGPCINYLAAVRWSPEQELAIRSFVSSYPNLPSNDASNALVLRLSPILDPLVEIKTLLQKIISRAEICDTYDTYKSLAHQFLLDNSTSHNATLALLNQNALLEALRRTVNAYYASDDLPYPKLIWLLDEFQDLNIANGAIEILATGNKLADLILLDVTKSDRLEVLSSLCEPFLSKLNCLFPKVSSGEVLVPMAIKMDLVKTWAPVFIKFQARFHQNYDSSILDWLSLLECLPITNQNTLFDLMIDCNADLGSSPISKLFHSYYTKLRQTVIEVSKNAREEDEGVIKCYRKRKRGNQNQLTKATFP